jgi:hypothetical protein
MDFAYLVTTDLHSLPSTPIIMVDGTVPGWTPRAQDIHLDHHRPGGADVQIEEIPDGLKLAAGATFVTTQIDADACAAVAWLQLAAMELPHAQREAARLRLTCVAYDCDHLGLPAEPRYSPYRTFAAAAVAALKESGGVIATALNLPADRRAWTEAERTAHASESFRQGSVHLIEAALGHRPWPGESGEAAAYFERMQAMRQQVYRHCRLYRGCAVLDQRPLDDFIDARLLVEWAREQGAPECVTLTVRDGVRLPNGRLLPPTATPLYSYTLGRVPLHARGSPRYSDLGVWERLAAAESLWRHERGIALPATSWGGRNDVGGSGWRDPALSPPEAILDVVLTVLSERD